MGSSTDCASQREIILDGIVALSRDLRGKKHVGSNIVQCGVVGSEK